MGTKRLHVWWDGESPLSQAAVKRLTELQDTQPEWPWLRKQQRWLRGQSLVTKIAVPMIVFLLLVLLKLWVAILITAVLCLAMYGPALWRKWQLRNFMEQLRAGTNVGRVLIEGDAGWVVLDEQLRERDFSLEAFTVLPNATVNRIIYHYAYATASPRLALHRKKRYAANDRDLSTVTHYATRAADEIAAALETSS